MTIYKHFKIHLWRENQGFDKWYNHGGADLINENCKKNNETEFYLISDISDEEMLEKASEIKGWDSENPFITIQVIGEDNFYWGD